MLDLSLVTFQNGCYLGDVCVGENKSLTKKKKEGKRRGRGRGKGEERCRRSKTLILPSETEQKICP